MDEHFSIESHDPQSVTKHDVNEDKKLDDDELVKVTESLDDENSETKEQEIKDFVASFRRELEDLGSTALNKRANQENTLTKQEAKVVTMFGKKKFLTQFEAVSGDLQNIDTAELDKILSTINVSEENNALKDFIARYKKELGIINARILKKMTSNQGLDEQETKIRDLFKNVSVVQLYTEISSASKAEEIEETSIDLAKYQGKSWMELRSEADFGKDIQTIVDEYVDMNEYGGIDGSYGPKTKEATTKLQQMINEQLGDDEKIDVDGLMGPETIDAYLKVKGKLTKREKTAGSGDIVTDKDPNTSENPPIMKDNKIVDQDMYINEPNGLQATGEYVTWAKESKETVYNDGAMVEYEYLPRQADYNKEQTTQNAKHLRYVRDLAHKEGILQMKEYTFLVDVGVDADAVSPQNLAEVENVYNDLKFVADNLLTQEERTELEKITEINDTNSIKFVGPDNGKGNRMLAYNRAMHAALTCMFATDMQTDTSGDASDFSGWLVGLRETNTYKEMVEYIKTYNTEHPDEKIIDRRPKDPNTGRGLTIVFNDAKQGTDNTVSAKQKDRISKINLDLGTLIQVGDQKKPTLGELYSENKPEQSS